MLVFHVKLSSCTKGYLCKRFSLGFLGGMFDTMRLYQGSPQIW